MPRSRKFFSSQYIKTFIRGDESLYDKYFIPLKFEDRLYSSVKFEDLPIINYEKNPITNTVSKIKFFHKEEITREPFEYEKFDLIPNPIKEYWELDLQRDYFRCNQKLCDKYDAELEIEPEQLSTFESLNMSESIKTEVINVNVSKMCKVDCPRKFRNKFAVPEDISYIDNPYRDYFIDILELPMLFDKSLFTKDLDSFYSNVESVKKQSTITMSCPTINWSQYMIPSYLPYEKIKIPQLNLSLENEFNRFKCDVEIGGNRTYQIAKVNIDNKFKTTETPIPWHLEKWEIIEPVTKIYYDRIPMYKTPEKPRSNSLAIDPHNESIILSCSSNVSRHSTARSIESSSLYRRLDYNSETNLSSSQFQTPDRDQTSSRRSSQQNSAQLIKNKQIVLSYQFEDTEMHIFCLLEKESIYSIRYLQNQKMLHQNMDFANLTSHILDSIQYNEVLTHAIVAHLKLLNYARLMLELYGSRICILCLNKLYQKYQPFFNDTEFIKLRLFKCVKLLHEHLDRLPYEFISKMNIVSKFLHRKLHETKFTDNKIFVVFVARNCFNAVNSWINKEFGQLVNISSNHSFDKCAVKFPRITCLVANPESTVSKLKVDHSNCLVIIDFDNELPPLSSSQNHIWLTCRKFCVPYVTLTHDKSCYQSSQFKFSACHLDTIENPVFIVSVPHIKVGLPIFQKLKEKNAMVKPISNHSYQSYCDLLYISCTTCLIVTSADYVINRPVQTHLLSFISSRLSSKFTMIILFVITYTKSKPHNQAHFNSELKNVMKIYSNSPKLHHVEFISTPEKLNARIWDIVYFFSGNLITNEFDKAEISEIESDSSQLNIHSTLLLKYIDQIYEVNKIPPSIPYMPFLSQYMDKCLRRKMQLATRKSLRATPSTNNSVKKDSKYSFSSQESNFSQQSSTSKRKIDTFDISFNASLSEDFPRKLSRYN